MHSDLVCTPTSARQAAKAVSQLLEREALGTFHLTIPHRSANGQAKRPKFIALSNAKIQSAGIPAMPAWQEAVAEYLRARTL